MFPRQGQNWNACGSAATPRGAFLQRFISNDTPFSPQGLGQFDERFVLCNRIASKL
jgi:hypothetical protein